MSQEPRPIGLDPQESAQSKGNSCLAVGGIALVVMTIGFLAILPNFTHAKANGRLIACKSNFHSLATALDMYKSDHQGHYPTELSLLVSGNYLKTIPTCAAAGTDTYSESYQASDNPDRFRFYCAGHNHKDALPGLANFPQYNSQSGLLEQP